MSNEMDGWHTCPVVVGRVENGRLIVKCPHCDKEHVHSRGTGHVMSDCFAGDSAGYLVVDPDSPREFTFRTPVWRIR
ncbi:hypothetical protein GCM10010385_58340 [Streptomyces geysiriensis]|uniref:hypothetical protein n=1 Tax=Streptomyces rochei TaxID=1928 RepID=UPI00177E8B4F|nr:hypothetical protein GCM10010385_58340 [Streptomyces geysiriensis]